MKFLDENFCLNNETGKHLYHTYAENMKIIDYHCHLNAKDIAEDRVFSNLSELWLSGDHYKWRLMRDEGIDEKYITGDGKDSEKIFFWSGVLEKSIGNPLYAWSHMELRKYFEYNGIIKKATAEKVIQWCKPYFESGSISARKLIEKSNVTHICTTDDPISDLKWHKVLKEDKTFKTKVLPSWRPDGILNVEKEEFSDYIKRLSEAVGFEITNFEEMKRAVKNRIEFFNYMGCRTADHGLDCCFYAPCDETEVSEIFARAIRGEQISKEDAYKYKYAMLLFMAEDYCRFEWVMQLHYGCSRNVNTELFNLLGADSGIDCINPNAPGADLAKMLDGFASCLRLPKCIVYSLEPSENAAIDTIVGCFKGKRKGYIQHGAAWWFNDHKEGIEEHLKNLAAGGVLGNFVGMLTDSRSFVSYTRHDYFRRILCNLIGKWVEDGDYPYDEEALAHIIQDICYNNALEFFNLQ